MMGQSDTESTCSSIRVNPGSPRDPSVFLDEAEGPMPLTFGRETAGSPSSSSGDSGDFDSSVIITGEVPKRNTRGDIPIIDLTSPDHEEHSVDDIGSPPQAAITETLSDVREIAERIEQRLQGLRRRVASIRQIRRRPPANSPLARVRRSCPYGRRERVRNRDRTENHITVSSPAPVFTEDGEPSMSGAQVLLNDVNPIPIPEEDTPIVIDIEDNEPDATPLDSELEPYSLNPLLPFDTGVFQRLQQARERTQNSLERARRLTQEARRTIEIVERRRPNCLHPDEVIAQRLQDHYDRESGLAARQQARSAQEAGSFTSRASTANVAAPSMSSPLQYRRRRLFRPHHFAGPDTVPDLLLPFVSVVSLPTPPPLHHFEPSADNEDYEALWNLSERLGPVKSRGLSKEAIERIPSYRYSSKDSKNGNCVICMMEYSNREKLRRLKCEHNYHSKCIDRWLKNNRTCPVCRSEVNP